ncbi:MAG: hypothetical protein QXW10_01395 [Candidatus Micrarchaeaceae archaeon]
MSFDSALKKAMLGNEFGKVPCVFAYKARAHISKSKIDEFGEAVYIDIGEASTVKYAASQTRYIAAMNIAYDMLLSIYEIDTSSLFAARLLDFSENDKNMVLKFLRSFKARTNFEARIIGMQNAQQHAALEKISGFAEAKGIPIVEVDLFGGSKRHIAMDSKVGVSYDILEYDRLYRPGELDNKATFEQFERSITKKP